MLVRRLGIAVLVFSSVAVLGSAKADAPPGRFVFENPPLNDVVLDTKTGLRWERTPDSTPWGRSSTACDGRTAAGGGWRVPTIRELLTIVDYGSTTSGSVLPSAYFEGTIGDYWSVTQVYRNGNYRYYVRFSTGEAGISDQFTRSYRCVR